jgi:hypothetical protein
MLVLKFFVDNGVTTQLIMSPARISNITGLYHDALYVYTEQGKFLKSSIRGAIEEEFVKEEALPGQ